MIGIDYDGTYDKNPDFFDSIVGEKMIVTGRPKKDLALLKKRLPDYKVITYPLNWPQHKALESDEICKALKDIAYWKAKMVKKHKMEVFFDDDYRQAKVIKAKNPQCLVLLVL